MQSAIHQLVCRILCYCTIHYHFICYHVIY